MRDKVIDVARGIAIILVIIGHSIQYSVPAFDSNLIFRYIYSVHMPLFMFISGYTLFFSRNRININFLIKKFNLLVVPFFSWFIISFYLKNTYLTQSFITRLIQLLKSPDYGLWFLWVLFLINIIFILLFFIIDKLKFYELEDIFIIFGIYLISIIPTNVLGLHLVKWYIVFFCIGYFVSKFKTILLKSLVNYQFLAVLLFVPFAYFWNRTTPPSFNLYLGNHFTREIVTVITSLYLYLTPLTGIATILSVSNIVSKLKYSNIFIFIGGITLEIYSLHTFFLHTHGQSFLNISYTFFTTLASTILAIIILKKIMFLRYILFGRIS
ncbi:MAG: acyltransferase family protein [Candidatus Shapirobacteria bacterium]|jgi:fucose 4-O-acetylase-like acetyltransferase